MPDIGDNSAESNYTTGELATETNIEDNKNPENVTAKKRRFNPDKKQLIAMSVATVIIATGGSVFAYNRVIKKDNSQPKSSANEIVSATEPKLEESDKTAPGADNAEGCEIDGKELLYANWSGSRAKLADLGLFSKPENSESYGGAYDYSYFRIGTTTKGQAIVLVKGGDSTIDEVTGIAIEDKPSHYLILDQHSGGFTSAYEGKRHHQTSSKSAYDGGKVFPELCVKSLTYNGQVMTTNDSPYDASISADDKLTKLQTYPNGTLYESIYKEETGYKMAYFLFELKDTRKLRFTLVDPFNPNKVDNIKPGITWTDGSKNDKDYSTRFRGCGSFAAIEIATTLANSDLEQIGTGPNNLAIYTFQTTNHPLFKVHYDEYKSDAEAQYFKEEYPQLVNLTPEQYRKERAIFLIKDTLGRYVVYVRHEFNLGGGCGKPVVYLYPTKPTAVSVQVDADVVISKPEYGAGWKVLAMPNGKLLTDGKIFDSLYWEGYGHEYPAIESGFVVERKNVEATMISHLSQLGLNQKESDDFMEFWTPHIPESPYVRLTWFGTDTVNKLAPLNINPKPDTLIRIFLDFEGLDKPINLPTQNLSSRPRNGFTVIEWAGYYLTGW